MGRTSRAGNGVICMDSDLVLGHWDPGKYTDVIQHRLLALLLDRQG